MTRPLDREEAVESALNAHVVSGYFCSCGQTVNHAIRHVATAVLASLDEFEADLAGSVPPVDEESLEYQRGWDDGWVARNTVPPAPPLIETLRKVADRAENRGLTEMAVALRQRADEWEAEDDHRD